MLVSFSSTFFLPCSDCSIRVFLLCDLHLLSWYAYRLTIITQTFCGLKEITLTALELQGKNQLFPLAV